MTLFVSTLATLLTAIAVWVGYRNHRLSVEKHKLELFEKRFAVYRGAQALLTKVFEDGGVKDLKTVFEYRRDTQVAYFLFGADIDAYLQSLDQKALNLWSTRASFQTMSDGDERTRLVIKENEIAHELIAELSKLKAIFAPYLRFKTWH